MGPEVAKVARRPKETTGAHDDGLELTKLSDEGRACCKPRVEPNECQLGSVKRQGRRTEWHDEADGEIEEGPKSRLALRYSSSQPKQ